MRARDNPTARPSSAPLPKIAIACCLVSCIFNPVYSALDKSYVKLTERTRG